MIHAATMVAAWIMAETGVGPSIASGSQMCSGNCADLPAAPMKSPRAIQVCAPPGIMSVWAKMSANCSEPV